MGSDAGLPPIAVVGMSARTAGAADLATFWDAIRSGEDLIHRWQADADADAPSRTTIGAHGVLADSDCFDAGFFGMAAEQARVTDPQHRLLLESTWHALEDAGYPPDRVPGRAGLIASCGANRYWSRHVEAGFVTAPSSADLLDARLGNDKDFLATRIAYQLNLRGPVLTVQTACSSSLVAIHLAIQNLLTYQADVMIAGGVSITLPDERGYTLEEGSALSLDGYCRPFDIRANGTVLGDGVGVVVLKRLSDAITDGDVVSAVIAGSALNNDGRGKVGFTAPSVDGQVGVIREALAIAGMDPAQIGYVEAHGTATSLGDGVELAALREAFGDGLAHRTCALGALKANIGHTDAAAGVLGLVKAVLCVRDGVVPPVANFEKATDRIEWSGTPFFVPEDSEVWPNPGQVRAAGVTSLGMGGTNVHVVLQQHSPLGTTTDDSKPRVLTLSARSPEGLARYCSTLADHLDALSDVPISRVAAQLRGRSGGTWRHAQVAASATEAATGLRHAVADQRFGRRDDEVRAVLMFSGQGTEAGTTARELAGDVPAFRWYFDDSCHELSATLGRDLAGLVARGDPELETTAIAQPVLFALQYAASRWLRDLGLEPVAVVGHSVGEFAAATVSGVLPLEHAARLVVERGRLMQEAPEGRMVAVSLGEADVRRRLPGDCVVAGVNAPFLSVVSGSPAPMAEFLAAVRRDGIRASELASRRAFHHPMMTSAADRLREALADIPWGAAHTPMASTLTGQLADATVLADPGYWVRQITEPVLFAAALDGVSDLRPNCWIEIGPGHALQTFAGASEVLDDEHLVAGLGADRAGAVPWRDLLARLWQRGADLRIDYGARQAGLVDLPGYPFARNRHWIDRTARTVPGRQPTRPTDLAPPDTREVSTSRDERNTVIVDVTTRLMSIWREVLGLTEVNPHEDFFEQGHSLAAVRLLSRVREQLAPSASLEAFFEEPTFDALRRQIERAADQMDPVGPAAVTQTPVAPTPVTTAQRRPLATPVERPAPGTPALSVIFFSAPVDEVTDSSYEVVLRTAKVADRLGFEAIWTPERHFHSFGGAYPNPSVLGAAIAAVTERVGIRAGSVVLPLHNPMRVAEEWAVVDQISRGRVAISFATGWHPIDFAFAPDNFADRYDVLERELDTVRRLWRGEAIEVRTGDGRVESVRTFPRPAQPDLQVWLSATASEDSFVRAGRLGANVLTALLSLSVDELADRVRSYRRSRADAGLDPKTGRVTVMAHTFIGDTREQARRICREPLKQYILEHSELLRSMGGGIQAADLKTASAPDREAVLNRAFEKYFGNRGLMGDSADAVRIMANLTAAGVDEVAALVDFGLTQDQIEESLTLLADARAGGAEVSGGG